MTPLRAVKEMPTLKGSPVLWGGVIIASDNLKDSTQLEILAYALDANQRPVNEQKPLGRFLAVQTGYLETSDYATGRLVTVKGVLESKRTGQVGEAEYHYPVVKISQIFLWPQQRGSTEPQIQFGFGMILHN
jgi:outer membrane lipoprotein